MAVESDSLQEIFNQCMEDGWSTRKIKDKLKLRHHIYYDLQARWFEIERLKRIDSQEIVEKNKHTLKLMWYNIEDKIAEIQQAPPFTRKRLDLEDELYELSMAYAKKTIFTF